MQPPGAGGWKQAWQCSDQPWQCSDPRQPLLGGAGRWLLLAAGCWPLDALLQAVKDEIGTDSLLYCETKSCISYRRRLDSSEGAGQVGLLPAPAAGASDAGRVGSRPIARDPRLPAHEDPRLPARAEGAGDTHRVLDIRQFIFDESALDSVGFVDVPRDPRRQHAPALDFEMPSLQHTRKLRVHAPDPQRAGRPWCQTVEILYLT